MLFPAKNEPNPNINTKSTPREPSPEPGQSRAESMGRHSDGDNASGNSLKASTKKSYNNLQQCSSATTPNETTTNGSIDDDEDEDELNVSDAEQFGSNDEDDEQPTKGRGDAIGSKLKHDLTKYKQELQEYNETTKDLEKKYMKINNELTEMQQKHDKFVGRHGSNPGMELPNYVDNEEHESMGYSVSSTSIGSDTERKSSKIFRSNSSFRTVLEAPSSSMLLQSPKKRQRTESKPAKIRHNLSAQVDGGYEIDTMRHSRHSRRSQDMLEDQENEPTSIKDMYNVLKDVINTKQEHKLKYSYDRDTGEFNQLYTTIQDLKAEQLQYRNIIRQQQERISNYHTRCVKAQDIMKSQKHEIDKLHVNNKQLESSIYEDIDTLRSKIDSKLKSVAKLPHLMREEHTKYEKVMRENCLMAEKLHELQKEANLLKAKIDELGKRKLITVNRLKAAERDLKIFKNYNAALKTEKRRMGDELITMKEQLDAMQAASKRQLARHREQSEKQRRELQKRIYDLELKLSRSQNSTSSLIQERDSLIAELQTQLHTLVHNFEVSQKHIRVLRRHIYSMTSGGGINSGASATSGAQRCVPNEPNLVRIQGQIPSVSRLSTPRSSLKTRS
ncbi:hypothetical protein ACLKA7_003187 [Drosophila subpalustris]